MNIEKANLDISNIKNPLVFIFQLLTNIEISDYELSIILRLFLKHHSEIAFTNNLKEIFQEELILYNNSWLVLTDFYKIIHKKISLSLILKKWNEIYKNLHFWNCDNKVNFLFETKEYFLAIYDCSHNGVPFHNKLIDLFNCNNYNKSEVYDNIKDRLELILKTFGSKIFECIQVPLIKVSDFYNLTHAEIISYLSIIFVRINDLLDQTIVLFNKYNRANDELDNLLNPVIINICSKEFDSDSDIDDFFN
jgi:hypothetical protein